MPNGISKHRVLAINFEAVTSGGSRVKTRGLRGRNAFSQSVVQKTPLMFLQTLSFGKKYQVHRQNNHSLTGAYK